ncbi:MAG TPA: Gfo/Idh/MocA family oxidoreductase [Chthonomonadales bacterium]|nr:Gfo/Idh/MocA family oxidoreductase [Chthonomonadales bacterium]
MTHRISRRRFLEDSAALLAISALPVAASAGQAGSRRRVGPNDTIRVGCIGVRGQGSSHINAYAGMNDAVVAAVCDCDTAFFDRAVRAVESRGKPAPKTYQDIRRLLEDPEIDVVSVATPNHWHALAAIWAMQAGKDVYLEKPGSHNVTEGRRTVQVARRLGRICQIGTQSRASAGLREAIAFLHDGGIGKVRLARGLCYKTRASIGTAAGPQEPPATVDYDLWLGPAQRKPVRRRQFHYDWHWFWDYGNGDIGNQGIHEMDKARWGLGKQTLPASVVALGGRFGYVDDAETPNTMVAVFDYGDADLIFEVRGLVSRPPGDDRSWIALPGDARLVGNLFYGDKGVLVMPSYSSATAFDNDGNQIRAFRGGGDHHRNFLAACRSRKHSDLFADCEEGHLSSALCHLANLSYLRGEEARFDRRVAAFDGDRDAIESFDRFAEHLAATGARLTEGTYRLGRKLAIDARRERIANDREANTLLTREYRAGFAVPDRA